MTAPHAPPPVRLVYGVNDAEQRAAIRELVRGEPQVRWIRRAMLAIPFVMVALSVASGWPLGIAVFRNAFWIVFALLALFVYVPWTVRGIVKAIRRADPDWDREQVVTLSDSGIRLESISETTEIPWSAVRRASETPEIVLIHIGAARVLYLPVRIIALQADAAALRHLLRTKLGSRANLASEAAG
jgi:hypothetical protein